MAENKVDRILETLGNADWIRAVYPRQSLALFQGFWGVFGWGEISVLPGWFTSLGLLVLISMVGVGRQTWNLHRQNATIQRLPSARIWWLCLIAVGLGWGMALLHVHLQPIPGAFVWSFGRYTFVAIIPSVILFVVGLETMLPQPLRRQGITGVLLFILVFDIATLTTTLIPYWSSF